MGKSVIRLRLMYLQTYSSGHLGNVVLASVSISEQAFSTTLRDYLLENSMAFVDSYVKEIIALEVALFHARVRLQADTDEEALHDLRIAVRRIRSLLIPVRSLPAMQPLLTAAKDVGRVTTPTRDLEVMVQELERRGLQGAADKRRARLAGEHRVIVDHSSLNALFSALDTWSAAFRASDLGSHSRGFEKRVVKTLDKHVRKLRRALKDADFDRHELRILVKRTRYLIQAFGDLSPLSPKAEKSLKAVQSALGSWHDHHQWCIQAKVETDLQPLQRIWEKASAAELAKAEVEMRKLARLLPKGT
jgi:CHAD domain-containing protein